MPQLVTWSYWDITMPYFPQTVPPDWGPLTNRPAGLLEFVSHIEGLAKWQIVNLRREIQSLKQVEWNVRPFTGADGKVKTGVDVTVRGDRHIYILPGQKAPIPPAQSPINPNITAQQVPISFAARTGPIGPPCGHPQAQAEIG